MKTPMTKNRNKAPMQCLCGLAVLVLFVSQLSYKFYVCANNPAWRYKYHLSRDTPPPQAATRIIFHTYQHCRALSLDKRFDLKLLFTLAPIEATADSWILRPAEPLCYPALSIFPICRKAHPLRGPPSIVFHLSILI